MEKTLLRERERERESKRKRERERRRKRKEVINDETKKLRRKITIQT